MEHRPFELRLISAKDLKDVNMFTTMDVYAVVSINGHNVINPAKSKTPLHKNCGKNPIWNYTMKFTLDESSLQQNLLTLVINIISDRVMGDTVIGQVHVPLKELLDQDSKDVKHVTYLVRMYNGKSKGSLDFSFIFGEKFTPVVPSPVHVMPAKTKTDHAEPEIVYYPSANYDAGSSHGQPSLAAYPPPLLPQDGAYPPQYGAYPTHYTQSAGVYPPPGSPYPQQARYGFGWGLLGGLLFGEAIDDVVDSFVGGFDF